MVKLFVGGFPLDMGEIELVQRIALYGDVVTIKIVRDKKTRKCKGYAFVEMLDRQHALQVKEALDGTPIKDKQFSINIVEEEPVVKKNPVYVKVGRPNYGAPVKPKRPRK